MGRLGGRVVNEPAIRVLSEARTKIAEGEWVRGTYYTRKKVKAREGGGVMGAEITSQVECYCAVGAVEKAADDIYEVMRVPQEEARTDALAALADAIPARSNHWSLVYPQMQVIGHNDRVIENKRQAMEWFDAAIKGLMG